MRKYSALIFMALASILLFPNCKTGEGCPTKQYQTQVNKQGVMSTKRGKSGLFPKSMRKSIFKN